VARHKVTFASSVLLLVATALVFVLTWRAERRAHEEAVHARIGWRAERPHRLTKGFGRRSSVGESRSPTGI
jgi:hypothetical protein